MIEVKDSEPPGVRSLLASQQLHLARGCPIAYSYVQLGDQELHCLRRSAGTVPRHAQASTSPHACVHAHAVQLGGWVQLRSAVLLGTRAPKVASNVHAGRAGARNQVRNFYVGKDFKGDPPLHLKIAAGLTTGALGIMVASPTDLVKVGAGHGGQPNRPGQGGCCAGSVPGWCMLPGPSGPSSSAGSRLAHTSGPSSSAGSHLAHTSGSAVFAKGLPGHIPVPQAALAARHLLPPSPPCFQQLPNRRAELLCARLSPLPPAHTLAYAYANAHVHARAHIHALCQCPEPPEPCCPCCAGAHASRGQAA